LGVTPVVEGKKKKKSAAVGRKTNADRETKKEGGENRRCIVQGRKRGGVVGLPEGSKQKRLKVRT